MSSRKESQKRVKPRNKPYKRDQFNEAKIKQYKLAGNDLDDLEDELYEEEEYDE